jgi:hypothetical protein
MELALAILMALGIFLVIPVIIGLSTIGIYLLNRRRALNTERAKALKGTAAGIDNVLEKAEYNEVTGSSVKSRDYVESK